MLQLPQQQTIVTAQQLARYRRLFVGRRDCFALQRANGLYVRIGRALTDHELRAHLLGKQTIATYVIDERGRCSFAVFDDDSLDRALGLERLVQVQRALFRDGILSYLEASRRGGHLRVFLAEPMKASHLRAWLLPYRLPSMEFYPKQDEGKGYGSLMRLPLGVHRLTGRRYPFVEATADGARYRPVATSLPDLLDWLDQVQENTVPVARQFSTRAPVCPDIPQKKSWALPVLAIPSYSQHTIAAWVAAQDPFAVIGRYVDLNYNGVGRCPFPEHHTHGDQHPSFRVYQPRRLGGWCWYCYVACQGGDVFDFLCRYHGLDAREMWRRIQAGEV